MPQEVSGLSSQLVLDTTNNNLILQAGLGNNQHLSILQEYSDPVIFDNDQDSLNLNTGIGND
ncbi:13233_t:CDS:2 [Gigaspora rosea]|nr:13233_t:CDS:2 [Gigaspora rosea]